MGDPGEPPKSVGSEWPHTLGNPDESWTAPGSFPRSGLVPPGQRSERRDKSWPAREGSKFMIRRRFLAAAAPCWFVAASAFAESGDPRFPPTITSRIGGKAVRLTLTGTAMRKKYGF